MAASIEFQEFLLDQLGDLEQVSARRMFGGAGLFYSDVMFGLIADSDVYFKVDDRNRPHYADAGEGPFHYSTKKGTKILTSYYRVPDGVVEERHLLTDWAKLAVAVAFDAAEAKPKKKKKPKQAPKIHAP